MCLYHKELKEKKRKKIWLLLEMQSKWMSFRKEVSVSGYSKNWESMKETQHMSLKGH